MSEQRVPQPTPVVVAHRGAAATFPENTIAAVRGAVDCGVSHIEFDLQLTADRVPVLLHDESLQRTGGVDMLVTANVAAEVCEVPVGEPARFGSRFAGETVPLLREALRALPRQVTVFIELKRQSLRAFGRRRVLSAVLPVLAAAQQRCVLISFDRVVLEYARELAAREIGWVLSSTDNATRDQIQRLQPEFVFCNYERLFPGALWPGKWKWTIYEVTRVEHAQQLAARGALLVESMDACRLQRELHGHA